MRLKKSFGEDELVELLKELKLSQKKIVEAQKIYEEKYKNIQKKKDSNLAKKPMPAFFKYQKDIKDEYKNKGQKITQKEISIMWKELDEVNKISYINKYKEEMEIYKMENE